jgi:hypothetical protein
MRRYALPLGIIVVALVSTVFLPFVNTPSLWFGLPSVMVWTAVWVVLITVALAAIEFSGVHADADAREAAGRDER